MGDRSRDRPGSGIGFGCEGLPAFCRCAICPYDRFPAVCVEVIPLIRRKGEGETGRMVEITLRDLVVLKKSKFKIFINWINR